MKTLANIFFALLFIMANDMCHAVSNNVRFLPFRSSLLKDGWNPFQVRLASIPKSPLDSEEAKLERRFPEIESCSVDAGMLCRFWYKKPGKDRQCLLVITKGENLKKMLIVFQKQDACPRNSG
jgi:hypothetical protein